MIRARTVTALRAVGVAGLTCATLIEPARSQDAPDLTVGLAARLTHDTNPDLTPQGSAPATRGTLDLSFGLTVETPASALVLLGSVGLLDSEGAALSDPQVTLTYDRISADADFHIDGMVQQSDAASINDITNFNTGTGQRRVASLQSALNLGTSRPLGFGLTAGVSDISYHNTPSPDLADSRTLNLGSSLRADLSPVLHANLGISASRFTQDAMADRDTIGYSAGLTLDRPTGPLALELLVEDTPDGTRSRLGFDHQIALATGGQLAYGLGMTRGVSQKNYVDGSIAYTQDLPAGTISVDLSRDVTDGAETNSETVQSRASLGATHSMTSMADLTLSLDWAEQRDTASGLSDANTSVTATWTQSLTEDWALDVGYAHQIRDQNLAGRGQSDQVSLALRRSFALRF